MLQTVIILSSLGCYVPLRRLLTEAGFLYLFYGSVAECRLHRGLVHIIQFTRCRKTRLEPAATAAAAAASAAAYNHNDKRCRNHALKTPSQQRREHQLRTENLQRVLQYDSIRSCERSLSK